MNSIATFSTSAKINAEIAALRQLQSKLRILREWSLNQEVEEIIARLQEIAVGGKVEYTGNGKGLPWSAHVVQE